MLKPSYTSQFKKDYRLQLKRHQDLGRLDDIIKMLVKEEPLPVNNRDHQLHGDYKG